MKPRGRRQAVLRSAGVLGLAAAALLCTAVAHAEVQAPAYKLASELRLAIQARQAPDHPWLRDAGGQRVVRVLITGTGRGSDLAAVREEIMRRGGQVVSFRAETSTAVAVLPAAVVNAIANRTDVLHVAADKAPAGGSVVTVNGLTVAAVPGFAPGTESLQARNDLALLGE